MWDTGLRRASEESREDEEDQRQIFFACLAVFMPQIF